MRNTVFITGGCGFIGSALVRYLIQKTNSVVINVDKLTYAANLKSVASVESSDRYFFENFDVCDESKMDSIFRRYRPNYVMHLAAESHVDNSIEKPAQFIETNVMGTFTLLSSALRYWTSLQGEEKEKFRFLHVSTDEVFGDLPHPDHDPDAYSKKFLETSQYRPSSPYSASKAASDHLVNAWGRTYLLPTLITNCSNNYGPYQNPEKLIPKTILSGANKSPIKVYGSGFQIRDWLYVDDHVEILWAVLTRGKPNSRYNIGGRAELRNIDVVHKVCSILDKVFPYDGLHSDLITYVADRPGHDLRYAIDDSQMRKEFEWDNSRSFTDGLYTTVKWYLDNDDWYSAEI